MLPDATPYISPKYSPRNIANIMNKFGLMPEIVNQLKKLDCNKYNRMKTRNMFIVTNVFFTTIPPNIMYNV